MNKTKNMKKYFKFKKHILILLVLWIIYLIGIPLHYTPYALQPSYWEFKKMCELNNLPKNQEKYDKILSYFDKKLDNSIGKSGYKMEYSNRIDLGILIHYRNSNSKILKFDNIEKMYFRPEWKTYVPYISGNEGNMDFRIHFDDTIDCRNFVGELDG